MNVWLDQVSEIGKHPWTCTGVLEGGECNVCLLSMSTKKASQEVSGWCTWLDDDAVNAKDGVATRLSGGGVECVTRGMSHE